jgi:tRNA dimethylallyltransferase
MRHRTLLAGLTMEREALYARIDARVDEMVAAGAGEEVARAYAAHAGPGARQALGFQELLEGDVDAMRRLSRNYARRQLTWMRKLPGVHLVDLTGRSTEEAAEEIARAAGSGIGTASRSP